MLCVVLRWQASGAHQPVAAPVCEQDIFSCGIVGAMFSGLLTASSIINRNLFMDMVSARSKYNKSSKKAKAQ